MESPQRLSLSKISAFVVAANSVRLTEAAGLDIPQDFYKRFASSSGLSFNSVPRFNAVELESISIKQACRMFAFRRIEADSTLRLLLGRGRKVLRELSDDERQVLDLGGFLDENPDSEIILWMDKLRREAYDIGQQRNMFLGRQAERLSFDRECQFVASVDPSLHPAWLALESDEYGYDIRSFRWNDNHEFPVTIAIEVKGFSISENPIIHITRHEYEVARTAPSVYWFHLWDLQRNHLYEIPSIELIELAPLDVDAGSWEMFELDISLCGFYDERGNCE